MEKRQLVRTFGSALAAATLSFGLFAAPAIAEMSVVANGEAEAYVKGNEDIKVGEVDLKQTATIWVPVDVKEMDVKPSEVEMTFSKDGRRKSQDIVVAATKGGDTQEVLFFDDDKNTQVTEIAKIKNLKKAWLRFEISGFQEADLEKILKGTWTADFVTFKFDDANEDDVVMDVSGATITANGKETDAPGITLEQGSLKVDLATMSSKDANAYRVNYTKDAEFNQVNISDGDGVFEATVVDPTDRKISVSGTADSSNAQNDNGYGNTTLKRVFTPLPSKLEGLYGLESLVAKVPVAHSGDVTVYNVDSYNDVTDGIYEVTAGLIIPVYRIYNSFDGQHLYTTDMLEAATRVSEGWTDEGIGWYGAANYWATAVKNPVYRLYNQWSHDHAYTDSDTERLAMVLDGWTDEGVSFYGLKDGSWLNIGTKYAEAEPVWRLFNQYVTFGTHHYTTSTDEYDALAEAGWTKENIGFNGVKVTQSFVDVQQGL